MTTAKKDSFTNKVTFWRNGKRVYDFKISGNIVEFSNGDIILISGNIVEFSNGDIILI